MHLFVRENAHHPFLSIQYQFGELLPMDGTRATIDGETKRLHGNQTCAYKHRRHGNKNECNSRK